LKPSIGDTFEAGC